MLVIGDGMVAWTGSCFFNGIGRESAIGVFVDGEGAGEGGGVVAGGGGEDLCGCGAGGWGMGSFAEGWEGELISRGAEMGEAGGGLRLGGWG